MQSTLQKTKITFLVSDVEYGDKPIPQLPYSKAIKSKLGEIEACSITDRLLVDNHDMNHPLLMALAMAFSEHHPVALSPDMFWLLICQGFAQHVGLNKEKLRDRLVAHENKKTIVVRRDDFIKGWPGNPWPEVFTEFSQEAQRLMRSDLYSVMVPSFSTTTVVEKAAFEVAFMDTMSNYFEWLLTTRCGIPEITLEGTPEDWKLLRENAQKLAGYDLDWWIDGLMPLLSKIEETAKGNIDRAFWQSIYKHNDMSGGPFITGWILKFFPYINARDSKDEYPNPYLSEPDLLKEGRPVTVPFSFFPAGISIVPFEWHYFSMEYSMEFLAGFVGIHSEPETNTLRPEIGWVIAERDAQVANLN
ncbi:MAG TPA: DUF4419 domain-containing protein [Flavisolibacter sp.]|nr:DUF4419 domain-containing protein [Flavisolibacter sp.]